MWSGVQVSSGAIQMAAGKRNHGDAEDEALPGIGDDARRIFGQAVEKFAGRRLRQPRP